MRTSFQSTSSSSAISMGSMVLTPWPISGFFAVMVTMPSAPTRMNALGVRFAGGGPCGACPKSLGSMYADKSTPPPAIALTFRKERRPIVLEIVAVAMIASLLLTRAGVAVHRLRSVRGVARSQRRGFMNGLANAQISSATADVAIHGGVNILIAGLRRFRQQRGRGHHLPGLAIAALWHVKLRPRHLDGVRAVRREPFDGCDFRARGGGDRRLARAHRAAADVHRAGAAQAHPTAIFRAAKIQYIANNPEKRHVRGNVHRGRPSINIEFEWHDRFLNRKDLPLGRNR